MPERQVRHALVVYIDGDGTQRRALRGEYIDIPEGPELDRLQQLEAFGAPEVPVPDQRDTIPDGLLRGDEPLTGPIAAGDPEAVARLAILQKAANHAVDAAPTVAADITDLTPDSETDGDLGGVGDLPDESADNPFPAPAEDDKPARVGEKPYNIQAKAVWVEYAVLNGATKESAEAMTKANLIKTYGG